MAAGAVFSFGGGLCLRTGMPDAGSEVTAASSSSKYNICSRMGATGRIGGQKHRAAAMSRNSTDLVRVGAGQLRIASSHNIAIATPHQNHSRTFLSIALPSAHTEFYSW